MAPLIVDPIVVDASVVIDALVSPEDLERLLAAVGPHADLVAPSLLDAEVLNGLRRLVRAEVVEPAAADAAVLGLESAPIDRYPIHRLVPGIWALRANLSAYDACYLALARSLGCRLLTRDRRLAGAPPLHDDEVLLLPGG